MKSKDTPFVVTEWDWFRLQLRLYALGMRGNVYNVLFDFETDRGSKERSLTCTILCKTTQQLIKRKASTRTQLKHYREWIKKERGAVTEILTQLPGLRRAFDLDSDLTYVIAYSYGAGTATVCECVGDEFVWKSGAP